jgi:hypothetical protein
MQNRTERTFISLVHAAKALLLVLACLLGGALFAYSAVVDVTVSVMLGMVLAVFFMGFRPMWYHQVSNRYGSLLACDCLGNAASLLLVVAAALAKLPLGWLVLAWALPRAIATALLVVWIHSRHGFSLPSRESVLGELRSGRMLFLQKMGATSIHLGVPVSLGYLVSPASLLDFLQAERILTAVQSLLLAIGHVSYPRILARRNDPVMQAHLAATTTGWQITAAFVASIVVFALAPQLLALFWSTYSPQALEALRWICWMLPVLALNWALGLNYLLPAHRDGTVMAVTLVGAGGTLFVLLASASELAHLGGVAAIAVGELLVLTLLVGAVLRLRLRRT